MSKATMAISPRLAMQAWMTIRPERASRGCSFTCTNSRSTAWHHRRTAEALNPACVHSTVERTTGWVVGVPGPYRVALGYQHIADDQRHDPELSRKADQHGKPVEPVLTVISRSEEATEVPPDRPEVQQLAGGEDQPVAPTGPSQDHQGQQPQHVLRRIHLAGDQECRHHKEGDRPRARAPRRENDQGADCQTGEREQP